MPAPMANTPVSTHGTGMPIAWAITRSCVVARIQMPQVPNFRNSQKPADDRARQHRHHHPVPGIVEMEEAELAGDRLGILRDTAPNCQSAYFCSTSDMPNVARIVVSGSRPISGRSVVDVHQRRRTCAIRRAAATSASQKLPVAASIDDADVGAQHQELAVREVDHVHDAEDQGQSGRHQRQDHPGHEAVDRLDQDLVERDIHVILRGIGGSRGSSTCSSAAMA